MPIVVQRVADIALSEVTSRPTVLDAAEAVSRVYDFEKHPYFVWMRDPSTRLEDFRSSQAPYCYFVENFSRGLAAVLARISTMGDRLSSVYSNVMEEHGYGEAPKSHRSTFIGYLQAIGVGQQEIEEECPIRIAVAYEALLGFCLTNQPEMGAAAMGIVEYTHIKIATMLAQSVHDRFWGDIDAQHHYRLHAEIDADHALGLFTLCEDGWSSTPMRKRIAYSMIFGAQVWWSLFDAMCPAALIAPSEEDGIRRLLDRGADRVSSVEIRRDGPRLDCALPLFASVGGGRTAEATATAINASGLLMRGIEGLPLDAVIELSVKLPARSEPLRITGCVRSSPAVKARETCIEFLFASEGERSAVTGAVHALMAHTAEQELAATA